MTHEYNRKCHCPSCHDTEIARLETEIDALRQRAERAEGENRKLRDAWPDDSEGLVRRSVNKWYRLSLATGEDNWIAHDTRDEAINAAAGITDSKKGGE